MIYGNRIIKILPNSLTSFKSETKFLEKSALGRAFQRDDFTALICLR